MECVKKVNAMKTRWIILGIGILIATFCVLFVCKSKNLANLYYAITIWSIIYTACVASYEFNKQREDIKLKYSINLVEYFDNEYLREVRDLTRALRDTCNEGEVAPKVLKELIENIDNEETRKIKEKCGINETKNLKRSLIYLFNYWQKVYTGIEYHAVNEKYIKHHLSKVFISQYERFKPWLSENLSNNDKKQFEDLKKLCEYFTNNPI